MSDEQASNYLQDALQIMSSFLDVSETEADLYERIVNAPFLDKLYATSLDLGIVVLLRENISDGMIDRVALSDTRFAKEAVRASAKPFQEIRIPLESRRNIISLTIEERRSHATEDWEALFTPALTGSEARRNQTSAGIECSIVYPLDVFPSGALIFSFYQPERNLTKVHQNFLVAYTALTSEKLRRFSKR